MFQESFPLTDKTCFLYGNPQSSHLLIQPVGAQDLSGGLEKEVACLKKMAGEDFLSQPIQTGRIYLSLGDKEERTKNQTMKTVGDNIRKLYQHYSAPDSVLSCTEELHHPQPEEQPSTRHFLLSCTLEWNPGGHFQHPEERTAQGFAWSMK